MYRHMDAIGIGRSTAAPPLWRLLWRVGMDVPPPLFLSFRAAALIMGSTFGLGWLCLVWLLPWQRQELRLDVVLASSLLAGAWFGVVMAAYMRWLARRHALPLWSAYDGGRRSDGAFKPDPLRGPG